MIATNRALHVIAFAVACGLLGSCGTAPDNATGSTADGTGGTAGARATPHSVELVELHASWNRACRMQERVTKILSEEFKGKVAVKRIDVDAEADAMKRYGIDSAPPAIAIIVDGEVKQRMSGLQSTGKLRTILSNALEGK